MRKILFYIALFGLSFAQAQTVSKRAYNKLYKKTERKLRKQCKKVRKQGQVKEYNPAEWWIQQYLNTMDPALGRPTPEVMIDYLINKPIAGENASVLPGTVTHPWEERGPNNVGGRTRALAWDPILSNKVWAGSVTGGLWFNTNITSSESSWIQVSSLWSNLNVTAIAFDPNDKGTMYVGTGEGYGVTASTSRGSGIWKSIDSGQTFTQLKNSSDFYYINDIVIRDYNGSSEIYVAVDAQYFLGAWHGLSSYGLKKSSNGGISWSTVGPKLGNTRLAIADLEIGPDNRLWAGSRRFPYNGADRGGGRVVYSDDGSNWTTSYTHDNKLGRVSIALAQSDSNYAYALIEVSGKLDDIIRTRNHGTTWFSRSEPEDADNGIPDEDFTRGQAWYDLVIAVDPNNENILIAGGIDLFRSTDGAGTWTQISKWSNNNNLRNLSCPFVHADQHAIIFKDNSSNTCLFGNDGGVFYSANVSLAASSSSAILSRNKNYNTTQFYWGDIANTKNSNNLIAGAQDNGTQKFTTSGVNSTQTVKSGDGAYCFIDKANSNKQIASYVYNSYEYTLNNWANRFTLINDRDAANGSFINCAEWDDNGSGLITNKDNGKLYRIKLTDTKGALETVDYADGDVATVIKAFEGTNGKSRVWIGNNKGRVFVTEDFWQTNPTFLDKTGTINTGAISDIFNWNSSDTVFVTLSNYGVNNIYYSNDGGSSWTAKDGNLPNVPVWSLVLNPNKPYEAVIGTESGIFATSNIFASSPNWQEYTEGMGNVKIATLKVRDTDDEILAVTHGRGIFTSGAFESQKPEVDFSADATMACTNEIITLTDASFYDPTSWAWSFEPYGNVTYLGGTDSTSQNPKVQLNSGTYSISLQASNSLGTNTRERTSYLTIKDIPATPTIRLSWDTLYASYSGTGTIHWFLNNVEVGTGDSLKLESNGYYTAYLKNPDCISDSASGIQFNALSLDLAKELGLSIYPNPAEDIINVDAYFEISEISFIDLKGKVILKKTFNEQLKARVTLPAALNTQTLIVQVLGSNGESYRKVMVVK